MVAVPASRQREEARQAPTSQYDMTYHDLVTLPDYIKCYEIWEGELIMNPAPSIEHQTISKRLLKAFTLHDPDEERGVYFYAPTDIILREDITVQPGILYISRDRLDIIKEQHVLGAPDLCTEILSPHTSAHDLSQKRRYYKEAGVREYWLVNPLEQTLTVYDLAGDAKTEYGAGETATSTLPVLEGLRVDVGKLFATP